MVSFLETLEKLLSLGPEYVHDQLFFENKENVIEIKKRKKY